MKKIIFLFAAMFAMTPVFAQVDDGEDDVLIVKERLTSISLGAKVGGTITSMTDPNEGTLYDASGMGLSAGLSLKARFGKASSESVGGTGYIGVGIEALYKQNVVKTFGVDEDGKEGAKLTVNYFEVPVFVQLYPLAKVVSMNTFYVEAGVSLAGTMSASPESLRLESANVIYKTGDLKGFDVRPFAGVGYKVPGSCLDFNARYYLGTSELAGNFPCKMNALEVSLALMFNIGKF